MIFLDACTIIYWIEMKDPHYNQFTQLLLSLKNQHGPLPFAISQLSLLECTIKPLKENNNDQLRHYQQFFHAADLMQISLSSSVIEQAAKIRALYNLTTPDALQAASALSIQSKQLFFISNDKIFNRVPDLQVITL